MARKEQDLNQVLSTKPADVVQEACQVLEKHGCPVKKLKSELYYSSTLCQVVFQVLHYSNVEINYSFVRKYLHVICLCTFPVCQCVCVFLCASVFTYMCVCLSLYM